MKDSWLRAAISDTTIVADLLLRLKDSPPPPPSLPHTVVVNVKCLPPSWGLRQPRSKQPLPLTPPPPLPPPPSTSSTTTTASNSKETTHPRRSPTTPLHWITCGGCDGGGCPSDGYDESLSSDFHVHPPPSDRLRSKVSTSTETPNTTTGKRPRRKKTFAELKEEESSLSKERIYLKKELAKMLLTVKEQRSINENLKRMKLDLDTEPSLKSEANSVDDHMNNTSNATSEATTSSVTIPVNKLEEASEPDSHKQHATSQEQHFVLPDLNMVPVEDTVGMS